MDNISKLLLKDKNKESFLNGNNSKQSPIPTHKNQSMNHNKIELSNSGDKYSKHTRDNSHEKEDLLIESVDDDIYHKKRLAKMDDSFDEGYKEDKDV